jgi:hypothetical protein
MAEGRTDPGWLADYARGTLRNKREELERSLHGRIGEHHRFVIRELLQEHAFLERRISLLEEEIERRLQPHAGTIARLCSTPRGGPHYRLDADGRTGVRYESLR